MIKKILICNRGEIAVRIIRTCIIMKIKTVAVYSPEESNSIWVRKADEAYCLEEPGIKGYLDVEEILEIAKKSRCDAIYPGYGFLSESAFFAKACEEAGYIFIGPSVNSIIAMGDKIEARRLMLQNNIPIIPGSYEAFTDLDKAKQFANELGYPVMIKAKNGGGGRGIRLVESSDVFDRFFREACTEAEFTFGNAELYIEKVITKARHIEVQILGDKFGNIVSLGERECSIQRHHQKIVEESPSVALDTAVREKIHNASVKVASLVNYYSAGTVEFLFDNENRFYFLEMNTRIQVEHPVTEAVTGVDIVEEMICIANGLQLLFEQNDLNFRGHAIEFRICAENPELDFAPDYGKVDVYRIPEGQGIRVDSGIEQGTAILMSYDNLCMKLIVWGQSREKVLSRSRQALLELCITGFNTNIPFHLWLLENSKFKKGDYDTDFIEHEYSSDNLLDDSAMDILLIAAAIKNKKSKRILSDRSNHWVMQNNKYMSYKQF